MRGASGLGAAKGLLDPGPFGLLPIVESTGSGAAEHLLYLVPWHLRVSAREQAHVLLARQPTARVCVLATDHHPLTLALVGSVLGDLARDGVWSNPGHGVQLAHQALEGSRSLIWHPQRFRPGYLTQLGDDADRARLARLELQPQALLYVGSDPPSRLAAALSGHRASRVDVTTESDAPYRSRGAVELTAMLPLWPSAPSGLLCASCGAYQVGDWCAFCNQHPSRTIVPARDVGGNPTLAVHV
ncbi:MAG: hypothetical protein J2P23_02780 [Microlunatus sp.]|nr:hypothetical protein [Microlunatus sp.]